LGEGGSDVCLAVTSLATVVAASRATGATGAGVGGALRAGRWGGIIGAGWLAAAGRFGQDRPRFPERALFPLRAVCPGLSGPSCRSAQPRFLCQSVCLAGDDEPGDALAPSGIDVGSH